MSLDSIVQLSISVENPIIDTASFGTTLVVSSEANGKFPGLVQEFAQASELLDAGFSSTGATYRLAQKIKGQNPSASTFMVGKRIQSGSTLVDYDFTIQPGNEADEYWIEVDGDRFEFVRPDGYTDTNTANALASIINLPDYTVSDTGAVISILSTVPGLVPLVKYSDNISFSDQTSAPAGLANDLAAMLDYNSGWYAVVLDTNTPADILTTAAFVEGVRRIFVYETSDSNVYDQGSSSDIFSQMLALSYANSMGIYSKEKNEGKAAAWIGRCLTFKPGTINWAHKTLSGVTFNKLSASQTTVIRSKRGNYYNDVAGSGNTFNGITASGEFIDTASIVHYLYARIQENVISAFKATPKIPYTNAGVARITTGIENVLLAEVGDGLSTDFTPFVSAPLVQSVSTNDRQARHLPGVTFGAVLSGAINTIQIRGTLTLDESAFA